MYDLLTNVSASSVSKREICLDNGNSFITLPNRVRIYGLGVNPASPGMKVNNASPYVMGNPGIILIRYDNPNNNLVGSGNVMSSDDTGAIVVYPNGRVISKDTILNKASSSTDPGVKDSIPYYFNNASGLGDLLPKPKTGVPSPSSKGSEAAAYFVHSSVCGSDGKNCNNIINDPMLKSPSMPTFISSP